MARTASASLSIRCRISGSSLPRGVAIVFQFENAMSILRRREFSVNSMLAFWGSGSPSTGIQMLQLTPLSLKAKCSACRPSSVSRPTHPPVVVCARSALAGEMFHDPRPAELKR